MKTFIVLALDTRRPKADGTCSILLRIIHHGEQAQITTGIYVAEKDWDKKLRKIKASHQGTESVTRLNNLLQKKKAEATDIITKLEEKKTLNTYTKFQLKELIEKKPETTSFFAYTQSIIDSMNEANRIGNARAYKSMLGVFKTFCNGNDISFNDFNLAFIQRFEIAHLKKGNSYNGLSTYLRTARAVFNSAIKAGLVEKDQYPFTNYEIKTTKTRKRAIGVEAIKKIENLVLSPQHNLYHARNYFLASFYLRGISFADLANLTIANIIEGRIHYDRKKTGKPYNIKITSELQQIFDVYTPGKQKNDFIFPIVRRSTEKEQYQDIMDARKRFNKKLKKIADLCEITENLTSYVSRHSFATRAKNLGFPVASISDMLGHENIKTTEVYLDGLSSDALDEMH